MMIDSVIWVKYINVTDRHTDSHTATAIAALTQCVLVQYINVTDTQTATQPQQ